MRKQTDIEIGVLLMLAEEADGDGDLLLPREVAERFRPPLTVISAENSLRHLCNLNLAGWRLKSGFPAYHITRAGSRIVEDSFDHMSMADGTHQWFPKADIVLDAEKLLAVKAPANDGAETQKATSPEGWVINNNVFQQNNPAGAPGGSKSANWAAWIGVVLTLLGIFVAIWLGGKL